MLSSEYKKVLQETHSQDESWGSSAGNYANEIKVLADEFMLSSLLDYGCGKGVLKELIGDCIDVKEYDPGLDIDEREPCDIVACIDVLEHVEPDMLDNVLADIKANAKEFVYFIIGTAPAQKILSDGRNAHLIIEDANWWVDKLNEYFDYINLKVLSPKFTRIVVNVK
jgi:predicted TPR repeat methyltransferase